MPRRARMYIPNFPYHIVQHGNNREACFFEHENYLFYLKLWRECSRRYGVAVHAYCLMANHIHFLVTPQTNESISNTMKVVGSRYAQHINLKYKRTGTLWEGRHRSSLVQTKKYLLACHRYIELKPVRALVVNTPEDYKWSSYGANACGDKHWLEPHEEYLALGMTCKERRYAYRNLFKVPLNNEKLQLIRKSVRYSQPLGDECFRGQIEKCYGIKLGHMRRGRPSKNDDPLDVR